MIPIILLAPLILGIYITRYCTDHNGINGSTDHQWSINGAQMNVQYADNEGGRPGAEDAVRGEGSPTEQSSVEGWGGEPVHAGSGQL